VPPEGVTLVLNAIAEAGGGEIGHYTHCAFTSVGEGHFKPRADADPYSGTKGQINHELEVRIESFCLRPQARAVMAAIRAAHPYEQPVIYLIPMLDEADL
jgi:hypothetical protein